MYQKLNTIFFILLFIPFFCFSQLKHKTENILLMGSRFEITPYASTDSLVELGIKSAIEETKRIENLISEWNPNSEVSQINKNAGIKPIKVSKELFDLIKRCIKVSELTDGAFDITWACAKDVWKFDGSMKNLPLKTTIDSLIQLINYKNIILDNSNQSVFLSKKGMAIGLGAIGKGYAANCCKQIMLKLGIQNGIVIAGGDLIAWGNPDDKKFWKIGIANPENPQTAIAWFEIEPMAVVTSGDYEHFVEFDGIKYSHILNPKTAFPVLNNLRSVTIICPDAEIADALATSVFVLGIEKGLSLVNQLKGVDCIIIDANYKFYVSDGISLNFYTNKNHVSENIMTIGEKK